jgi:hypothetical protein
LANAQANLAEIELAYYRANLALVKGQISLDETYQTSLIDYRNAQTTYDLSIKKSQASYEAAKIALDTAQSTLATFESTVGSGALIASAPGKISAVGFAAGDTLTAATPYVTLVSSSAVSVPLTVDQSQISLVAVGDPAEVSVGQAIYDGVVSSIQTTSSSTSRSNVYYTITVEITGDLNGLSSDLNADVILNPETVQNVLYLPIEAIQSETGSTYVLLQSSGQTVKTPVEVGQANASYTIINSGLSAGDVVVLNAAN